MSFHWFTRPTEHLNAVVTRYKTIQFIGVSHRGWSLGIYHVTERKA